VSARDPEKKDLDKRVRSLTILTAKMEIPTCLTPFFDSMHPLPQVGDLQSIECYFAFLFSLNYVLFDALFFEFFCRTTNFRFLALIFPRKDPSMLNLALLIPKPLRLVIIRTGMKPKVLRREVTPLCRLLQLSLKLKVLRRNRNTRKT
jgi:hypothetical protein